MREATKCSYLGFFSADSIPQSLCNCLRDVYAYIPLAIRLYLCVMCLWVAVIILVFFFFSRLIFLASAIWWSCDARKFTIYYVIWVFPYKLHGVLDKRTTDKLIVTLAQFIFSISSLSVALLVFVVTGRKSVNSEACIDLWIFGIISMSFK